MKQRTLRLLIGSFLIGGIGCGQTPQPANPSHYIEIKLPPEVNSSNFFVRFVLTGQDFGGWIQAVPGVSSYSIDTTVRGHAAKEIRGILYAQDCAIQTLSLTLSESENPQVPFLCQPARMISIDGELTRSELLGGHNVRLQAKYVARWAARFLRIDDSILTSIPIGSETRVEDGNRFHMILPDLSQDPVAADQPGEIQVWAKDDQTNAIVAQLIPAGPQVLKTQMGGVRLREQYPEIVFAPCVVNSAVPHDRLGFSIRPGVSGGCDR